MLLVFRLPPLQSVVVIFLATMAPWQPSNRGREGKIKYFFFKKKTLPNMKEIFMGCYRIATARGRVQTNSQTPGDFSRRYPSARLRDGMENVSTELANALMQGGRSSLALFFRYGQAVSSETRCKAFRRSAALWPPMPSLARKG